jgi:hypothetical protein
MFYLHLYFHGSLIMCKKYIILLSGIFLVILQSCSTSNRIATLRPEADSLPAVSYETETSFINLGVSIGLKDLEMQVNKAIAGVIYEDKNLEDDKIMMKVEKQGMIKIQEEGGKMKTVLPLKIWTRFKYGTSLLGISLYDTRELNLNGVITFVSDISMSNWKLITHSNIKSLEWKESPSIQIGGRQVAITYLINPAISLFKPMIEKSVDDAIKRSVNFRPEVLNALENIAIPIEMNHAFNTWFRVEPVELYATDARLNTDKISMRLGLKCQMETFIGERPENTFDRNRISLKAVSSMPDRITANLAVISGYEEASHILTKNFKGQEFSSGKNKVVVEKVELWQKGGKMIVALDLIGSLNGRIYLSGIPKYDSLSKEIYFDQMEYVLDTKSKLLKIANWMGQSIVLRKIQQNCRYSVKANLDESKHSMMKYLDHYSPMQGVFFNGSVGDIEFKKIVLNKRAIVTFLSMEGKLEIDIHGLQ